MTELLLVRHGQADFDGEDYDRLTDLGRQQAAWLGAHLLDSGARPASIHAGRLRRQQETAAEIASVCGGRVSTLEGLEEYDADALIAAAGDTANPGSGASSDRAAHFRRLRAVLAAWAAGDLHPVPESFAAFRSRSAAALETLAGQSTTGPVLAVTSGGVIAAILAGVLDLAPSRLFDLNLQMRNTGVTRLIAGRSGIFLNQFNAVPHLERPDRSAAITYS
ncbi:MAG: histidine phosphatase family protein [Pseudomonadota bacterium]